MNTKEIKKLIKLADKEIKEWENFKKDLLKKRAEAEKEKLCHIPPMHA
jgi:cellobiose-specific phosphotransferase system component IIA